MLTRRTMLKTTTGLLLTAAFSPFLNGVARANAPAASKQAPGYYRIMVGDYEVTCLSDGTIDLPMTDLYQGLAKEEIEAYLAGHYQSVPTTTSVNAFLVNTGERLILIDAGSSDLMGPTLGKLPANLQAAGYSVDQVDDIILTHIHPDHSGGLVLHGQPVFPNAVVHANQREFQFWLNGGAAASGHTLSAEIGQAEAAISPYRQEGRFSTFADNSAPVPGLKSVLRGGHTPGHSAIVVESRNDTIVFWGDIVHGDYLQYDNPDVTFAADIDQAQGAVSRLAAFTEAAERQYIIGAAHHAFPGVGRVRQDETNFDWVPLAYSSGLQAPTT